MMTSCLLIVMWQVKKKKENSNFNIQTQKKSKKKNLKKTSSEWITEVMSQAAKDFFLGLNI